MLNGYQFRLYQWTGCQRVIYNAKVRVEGIFRQVGPEWSEMTSGKTCVRRAAPSASTQRSPNREHPRVIPKTPTSTRQG